MKPFKCSISQKLYKPGTIPRIIKSIFREKDEGLHEVMQLFVSIEFKHTVQETDQKYFKCLKRISETSYLFNFTEHCLHVYRQSLCLDLLCNVVLKQKTYI